MCGGGSSTSSTTIPPEVLARYNAVNARAEDVAKTPFQPYTGDFVADLTPTQTAGIYNTSAAATQAQPYYAAATGLTMSGAQDVGKLTPEQIQAYQNPYTQSVVDPTIKALQQQQGEQLSQQQGNAIKSGAAFGERSGLQRAQLMGQQNLAMSQAISPLYQKGYEQAVQTAQGQQGVQAADLTRRAAIGQQIAGIGTAAQTAGLQGAQAQIGAGTLEQQTQQAQKTADYNQFLQERGYDFQTAQFLANIAMGTGALTGSSTTTSGGGGFFSDERLKHDAHKIGETNDGLPIYSFKYNGDNKTQIGLMAQDVEKKRPEAVGLAPAADGRMYKTVDYDKATRHAKEYGGGLMGSYDPSSMGGAVGQENMGQGYADGGMPGSGGNPGVVSWVPAPNLPVGKLLTSPSANKNQSSGLASAAQTGTQLAGLAKAGGEGYDWLKKKMAANGGLIVPRHAYATDGSVDDTDDIPYNPQKIKQGKDPLADVVASGAKHIGSLSKSGPGGGGGQQSGLSQLAGGLGAAKTIFDVGSSAAAAAPEFLTALMAFSDKRLKHDTHKIGETNDGLPIYSFKYNGDDRTQIGLMAQDVEKKRPEAVGLAPAADGKMYKTVDYERAVRAYGGLVPREHHDGEDGNVVGEAPKYRIEPQNKEDMDPHWQNLVDRIYGGEGGRNEAGEPRYNIRQGGQETFDPELGHPGRGPARGGESSAAGAGQFIHDTWHRVTGGAPMTKGYQDAATKQLAMQDYKARTGRDLDADLREQGTSPEILRTLSPTWTSLDKHPSPTGLVGRGESRRASYNGKDAGQASLGDVIGEYAPSGMPTSSNFWVPLVSGVGSMLASKNPTLGGAIGEGLVGGVAGYAAQQNHQMAAAKQVFDLVKDRFQETLDSNNKVVFKNKMTGDLVTPGQVQAAVARMLKSAGVDPESYGVTSGGLQPVTPAKIEAGPTKVAETTTEGPKRPEIPAGRQGAPATKTETATPKLSEKPPEEWSPTEIDRDVRDNGPKYGLEGSENPKVIQSRIDQMKARAAGMASINPAEASNLNQQAQQEQTRLDALVKHAGSQQLAINQELAKQRLGNSDEFAKAVLKRDETYHRAKSELLEISRLQGEGLNTGYGSEALRNMASLVKTLTGQDIKVSDPASFDYASKIAMQQITNNLAAAGLQRAPRAGIEVERKITPGTPVDPGAIYQLLGQTLGDMEYIRDRDREYMTKHRGKDPASFSFNYNDKMGDEGYNRAIAKGFNQLEIPNDKSIRKTIDSLAKKYVPYGYDPTKAGSGNRPAAQETPAPGTTTTNVPYKVLD
jgi:muramidase (phage lysozyme)